MNEVGKILGDAFLGAVRQAVREEIQASIQNGHVTKLLTPEELADRLQVPRSWVYEQSRMGNIPTHRLGRYIRFDLHEVLESQKKD
ncbi:MAG: helix-turn-helix domain-containing protein [Deltaproteobacteria bacterium]|nr:helix-turn-helix domain-containing protein [Deltaproteobacteria bacterium]